MLEIRNLRAQIGIRSHRAKLNIRQIRPRFQSRNVAPQMKISNEAPSFTLDNTRFKLQINQGPIMAASRKNRDVAVQNTLEAIGNIVEKGNFLSEIENKGNTIAAYDLQQIAADIVSFELAPTETSDITWNHGKFEVNWSQGELEISWDPIQKPDVTFDPGTVEVFMVQYPEVKISYTPPVENIPKSRGRVVDKKI